MNPRPKVAPQHKREIVVRFVVTEREFDKIEKLWKLNDCRDRSDYLRKVSLGELIPKKDK